MSLQLATAPITEVQSISDLKELNIYNTTYLLESLENQLAILEGGKHALASKSFRSARFTLLKQLADGKAFNILSYEPASAWNIDLKIFERFNINILFVDQYANNSLVENIKTHNIGLIYLSSIHSSTLAVEDHRSIIHQAHSFNLPVVFDNTSGALGAVYQPLVHEADYVVTNTAGASFNQYGIGGYIVEGYSSLDSKNAFASIITGTTIEILKRRRQQLKKQPFLFIKDQKSFEVQLAREVYKHKTFAKNTFIVAKWLNHSELVMEVNYPGLKTSDTYLNAESHLKGGYGQVLKFKLWEDAFSYNLLRSYFKSGRPKGLLITEDNQAQEFTVQIQTESTKELLSYFQHVLSLLNKELEYRSVLKKQLKLQKAVNEILHSF